MTCTVPDEVAFDPFIAGFTFVNLPPPVNGVMITIGVADLDVPTPVSRATAKPRSANQPEAVQGDTKPQLKKSWASPSSSSSEELITVPAGTPLLS